MSATELMEKLSKRQREVMLLMSEGLTLEEMAAEMRINKETVRSHLRVAMLKWGMERRMKAARVCWEYQHEVQEMPGR